MITPTRLNVTFITIMPVLIILEKVRILSFLLKNTDFSLSNACWRKEKVMAGQALYLLRRMLPVRNRNIFFGINKVIFTSFSFSDSDPKLESFFVRDPKMVTSLRAEIRRKTDFVGFNKYFKILKFLFKCRLGKSICTSGVLTRREFPMFRRWKS